jgi:hypothetical protein
MATQKKGGGSNLALIITLVFFVLSTVVLGVLKYLDSAELDAKEKKVKEAAADKAGMEKKYEYHRTLNYLWRIYMGKPSPKADAANVNLRKQQIVDKTLPDLNIDGDGDEVAKVVTDLSKVASWPKEAQVPGASYEKRLADKDAQITALSTAVAEARKQEAAANDRARAAAAREKAASDRFAAEEAKIREQAKKDREDDRAEIDNLRAQVAKISEGKGTEQKAAAAALALNAALTKEKDGLKNDIEDLKRELRKARGENTELAKERDLYKEKSGRDASEVEAKMLDDDALKTLRNWDVRRKSWRIVDTGKSGLEPYINLGSADGLQPQMTFSIHQLGPDGRLVGTPKGTLEVVKVVGAHLSRARLTSSAAKGDRDRNPITKGDYLFNATWDIGQKRRVVLAGLADITDTQADSTRELRELLRKQNVELGGWIDTSDDKGPPKLVGTGVNRKTDYVILGDSLDDVKHPRIRDEEFRKEFVRIVNSQRDKARNEAIPVVTLRRYLQMIGYVPPRVEKTR